jgi:hypothetical protein
VQYYPDEHDGSDARVRQVPSMSDMLICYPTQNGEWLSKSGKKFGIQIGPFTFRS